MLLLLVDECGGAPGDVAVMLSASCGRNEYFNNKRILTDNKVAQSAHSPVLTAQEHWEI